MAPDDSTVEVYNREATEYARRCADHVEEYGADVESFLGRQKPGARILDWGCGPGQFAAAFQTAGFSVDCVDASTAMAELARELHGIEVEVATFDALDADGRYDGIWASFSLLHAPRADFPRHLDQARRALKESGVLSLGMKLGEGEAPDELGRFYTYYTESELEALLDGAGFDVLDKRVASGTGLAGIVQPYIVLIARRTSATVHGDSRAR